MTLKGGALPCCSHRTGYKKTTGGMIFCAPFAFSVCQMVFGQKGGFGGTPNKKIRQV